MIKTSLTRSQNQKSLDFIEKLYADAFPPEERREFREVKRMIDEQNNFSLLLIEDDLHPIGLLAYWEWPDFIYIEHIAISEQVRNRGYGRVLLADFEKLVNRPIILEVELPENEMSQKRIGFYKRCGYQCWSEVEYLQPSYGDGKPSLKMLLMCKGALDPSKESLRIINEIHNKVYGI